MKKNRLLKRTKLIAQKNGIAPIETLTEVALHERLDYALSVCTNQTKVYKEKYHLGARNFIKKTLNIEDDTLERLIQSYAKYSKLVDKPRLNSLVAAIRFTTFDATEFNQDLSRLNKLIEKYNTTDSFLAKKSTLMEIYLLQNNMGEKYKNNPINTTAEYQRDIKQMLPNQLREHFKHFSMSWPNDTVKHHASQQPSITVEQQSNPAPIRPQKQIKLSLLSEKTIKNSNNPFQKQFEYDIKQLNGLIKHYNLANDSAEQIKTLRAIRELKKIIEDSYPGDFIEQTPQYRTEIQEKLTDELRAHYHHLNIAWSDNPAGSFAAILDAMPSNKVSQLMHGLLHNQSFNLNNVYKPNEPGYQEFQQFLRTHDIQALGGFNSKNFKIIPKDGSPPYVLKIDNRLGTPKTVETHLRAQNTLQQVFIPVRAERSACVTIDKKLCSRAVIITELCRGGDIETDSMRQKKPSERITDAIHIYSQMAEILKNIEAAGCAFPDMKNSNWLLDDEKNVRLADTKSFLPTTQGQLVPREYEKLGYALLTTKYMSPPEYDYTAPFSAEKAHAFLLGKNLYHYLTKCKYDYLEGVRKASELHFPTIFTDSQVGGKLKTLIEKLIQPSDHIQISVTQALAELKEIQKLNQPLPATPRARPLASNPIGTNTNRGGSPQANLTQKKQECHNLLKQMQQYPIGNNDTVLSDYIKKQQIALASITTLDALEAFQNTLNRDCENMRSHDVKTVKEIIQSFRDRAHPIFTIGMKAKADRIEQALSRIPIEQRGNLLHGNSAEIMQLKGALASHRYLAKYKNYKTIDGNINEEKAAKSYTVFKQTLAQIKQQETETSPDLSTQPLPTKR